ncbi:hypothetical protein N431DRAFT_322747 [Stipitochalara longipes BDJ]|nr:hypothetical protein N431DRAFT_322747 [Stipitochalara longipes BDJ]
MEEHASSGKEAEKGLRGRLMGKLRKEKKAQNQDDVDVDEFLHGPSDKLLMMPIANEPAYSKPLARIDTNSARRWPSAAEVQNARIIRGRSASPKRRKGLVVRFAQEKPEVIGEGGDDATSPVSEIGMRKRANSHPPTLQPNRAQHLIVRRPVNSPRHSQESFRSQSAEGPTLPSLQRTQTGFESIPEPQNGAVQEGHTGELDGGSWRDLSQRSGSDRRSFAEIKADFQSGEGLALVKAASNTSIIDQHLPNAPDTAADEISPQMDELHLNTIKNVHVPSSPGIPVEQTQTNPITSDANQVTEHLTESPAALSRASTLTLHEAAVAVGDDALQDFSSRVVHLFTLFRLSTEAVKPLPKCTFEELVRLALWWFLKGRLYLETAVRDGPSSPHDQQTNFFIRQQAYADLAKSLWLIETITSQYPETHLHPGSTDSNTLLVDILDVRQGIMASLRKLTMSMKRNNFLPPDSDDVPFTQGLDTSIWVQDDGNRSLIASQRPMNTIPLSETFPLSDTTRFFFFSRMFVVAVLLEVTASQHYRCPVLVSIVRGQRDKEVTVIIANQDGSLNLAIQSDKTRGPSWEDVRWQSKHNTIELLLPRGFVLRLHCSEHEFRTLWEIYDYEKKTHASLHQRSGEQLVFETVLRTFQLFDQGSHPDFPKEPLPHSRFRLFEKTVVEKAATGPRTMHRGFRVGLITSSKTKHLRGVDQELLPNDPIQFGFLRGEGGFPALLLKIRDGISKYTMVYTFEDVNERTRLHTLVAGIALGNGEDVVAEGPMKTMAVDIDGAGANSCLRALEFSNFRFINQGHGAVQGYKTVLSENLRVVIDFKAGSITDRINVGPGELKLRLDINKPNELRVLRQPQQDMTVSVSEAQVSKELPQELAMLLVDLSKSESTRIYTFPSTKELHLFQGALTGFSILFDGIASSFNISRRRMVVPIYRKWDAMTTRLQIVQKETVVQLVAFFENFSHGDCMNFTIKSTDTFEASSRSGKYSLRIVDAKFAMPKSRGEGESDIEHKFVCLDMPEYPGEHDDITIVFDNEEDREALIKVLPAPVKAASRMSSVRR